MGRPGNDPGTAAAGARLCRRVAARPSGINGCVARASGRGDSGRVGGSLVRPVGVPTLAPRLRRPGWRGRRPALTPARPHSSAVDTVDSAPAQVPAGSHRRRSSPSPVACAVAGAQIPTGLKSRLDTGKEKREEYFDLFARSLWTGSRQLQTEWTIGPRT
jgi:hypothetical protein